MTEPDGRCFDSAGYALIRTFVRVDELPVVAEKVDRGLALPPQPGCSRPGNDLRPLRWNDDIVAFLLGSARRLRLLHDALQPADLKWISGYISSKPPRSPPLWWHQDWWNWHHPISFSRAPAQVALLCYLTETGALNGALRLLPGSHRTGTALHRILPEPHAEAADALPDSHAALADAAGQITVALAPGDAVVIDYRLLHGTHGNTTAKRRDGIILSFVPAWRALPRDIRAHLISHPALPGDAEAAARSTCAYDGLLPRYDGKRRSLGINRVPPDDFAARVSARTARH
jgi:hypothetical protein